MEGQKESPEYSVYAVRNTRRLMEDRHVVIPDLLSQFKDKGDKHYSYYAVFDGHAGPDAAQFAIDNLHKNLVENPFFQSGNFIDAFRNAYAITDFQYTEKSERDGIKSGCTAVTCLLENKKKLYIAWVGDSVALLSRNGKPCFITEPHNLERDDEKERVESMGGTVIYFDTWRVNGTLSVSRAIGDPEYKPYVCSDPDIEQIDLDGTEDFLIIGCDGLWDRMSPEDAIGLIYQHIQTNCHLEPSEIVKDTAKILADRAIADGSNDNVTTIVIFLRDVASIINTSSSVTSETSNNVFGAKLNGDNLNTYDLPTGLNNINSSNNNNNNYDNGLIDTSEYESRPMDNGLINKEVIDDTIGASEEKDIVSQLEGKNSTLNPFADEFQPNITSNNIIENQFGNEPKKDDEELHKNDSLEKKDLWMSESKNDGNNEQHQQDYSNQAEMLDGLVVNGLSAAENLSGNDVNQLNYSSRFEENFLSSEEVVQQNPHDLAKEPSAPELISIDQEQFTTMEANISQAEIFVGNLTPTEVPSTPLANNQVSDFPEESSSRSVGDHSSQYSFETSQSNPESNVNQYITSVSDAMGSEPYHDPYFASDSVEPESIIVNTCDDVISSGPHAIDPYSGDDKELESDSNKEFAEVPLNQPLTEEVAIEVTDNAPLGSSNPFGSSILNESQAHLAEELEAKMPTEEEKSFFTEDNSVADNSSALLDFSADQVNEIVLSPYPANESSIIETKFMESVEEPITEQEFISQEVSPPEKSENLSVITEKTTELNINDESEAKVPFDAPITESNQTEDITELICGSTEEKPSEAIVSSETEASKEEETIGVTTTAIAAAAAVTATAAAVSGVAISSKSSQPVIKESTTKIKSNITKKSTAPLSKTTSRTTTSSVKPSTATTARKPLPTTSTTKTASYKPSTGLASSKLTSKPTSTSTVKSTTTSRIGTTTALNKKPTQTSTTTSGISRISSLASRTSSSTAPPSSTTTTGKPLTRTTTTTASSAASRKPLTSTTTTSGTARTTSTTKPTLSSRTTTSSSRTVTSSTTRTGVKETDKKETSNGLTKPTTKRASTGSMLNRPSPGASSLTNKASSSPLNRSMTNSSRPGASTNTTVSKLSTRPSSSTMSSTRSPGLSSTRSIGAKTSATNTTKSTTSTNKVAVSRLGANRKPTASTTSSKEATSVTNSSSINSTGEVINCNEQKTSSSSPVDATTNLIGTTSNAITNSIKRDKNMMPNSANSLKDELEAALASPISCEDKGVIKGTKDNESSENL